MSDSPELPEAADQTEALEQPEMSAKVSKIDVAKQRQLEERRRRLLNQGVPPEKVDEVIAKQDWDRLPVDKKILRLERVIVGNVQGLGADLQQLRHNQNILADIMDVNFRAFEKMLVKLGLPVEEQRKLLQEAEAEIKVEREAQQRAYEAQMRAQQEAQEQAQVQAAVDQPAVEPVQPPDGATVFGG